jgi:hypothetical protein
LVFSSPHCLIRVLKFRQFILSISFFSQHSFLLFIVLNRYFWKQLKIFKKISNFLHQSSVQPLKYFIPHQNYFLKMDFNFYYLKVFLPFHQLIFIQKYCQIILLRQWNCIQLNIMDCFEGTLLFHQFIQLEG